MAIIAVPKKPRPPMPTHIAASNLMYLRQPRAFVAERNSTTARRIQAVSITPIMRVDRYFMRRALRQERGMMMISAVCGCETKARALWDGAGVRFQAWNDEGFPLSFAWTNLGHGSSFCGGCMMWLARPCNN